MNTRNEVSGTPKILPENYSALLLTYVDHNPVRQDLEDQIRFVVGDMSERPGSSRTAKQLPKAMGGARANSQEIANTVKQCAETKKPPAGQERETDLSDLSISEQIEALDALLDEQRKEFDDPKTRGVYPCPPDSSSSFDYQIEFIARKHYLPDHLLDKALRREPGFLEGLLIKKLGEKIHDYDCLITDFRYGWRLGDPLKPYEVLLSLSDKYIEDLCKQILLLAGPQTPFQAQDLKEARERIASLTQQWKDDRCFSNENLAWIAHVGQHIINWSHATLSDSLRFSTSSTAFLTLKHLRYPPKFPPKLCFEPQGSYSPDQFSWAQHLAQLSFYMHYMTLFLDMARDGSIKICAMCAKLFSRSKTKKGDFSRRRYCSPRCRSQAEKRRYYGKHQEELRRKHREYMRETRKVYKEVYKEEGMSYDKKVRSLIETP